MLSTAGVVLEHLFFAILVFPMLPRHPDVAAIAGMSGRAARACGHGERTRRALPLSLGNFWGSD
eukprot:6477562-Amphidinium_carterae.1